MKAKFKNPNYRKLSDAQKIAANSKRSKSEFDSYISMVMKKENKFENKDNKKTKILLASIGIGLVLATSLTIIGVAVSGKATDSVGPNTLSTLDASNNSQMIFVERKSGTAKYKIKFTQSYNGEPVVTSKELNVSNVTPAMNVGGKEYDSINIGDASTPLKVEVWAYDKNNKKLGYLSKNIGNDKTNLNNRKEELLNF